MSRLNALNLTQHTATPDQLTAGVFDLNWRWHDRLKDLLTFDGAVPSAELISERAEALADIAHRVFYCAACHHIGGYCGDCSGEFWASPTPAHRNVLIGAPPI